MANSSLSFSKLRSKTVLVDAGDRSMEKDGSDRDEKKDASRQHGSEGFCDSLAKFLHEKNVELSFQSKRNYTKPELLSEYVRELEGAVRKYSGKSLDVAMAMYRKGVKGENNNKA